MDGHVLVIVVSSSSSARGLRDRPGPDMLHRLVAHRAHIHPTPARAPPYSVHEPQPSFCLTKLNQENCRNNRIKFSTEATAAADAAKSGGIQIITIAVRDSSTELDFLFTLNSTNLGFVAESFEEAELVTDAILGEIDIPCPP